MSENIFNQNQNSLFNNNELMNYEPNASQRNSRVVLGIEKKLISFNIDPGILQTGLNDYLNNQSLRFSKSIGENAIIKEIIKKIEELSNNLVKVVNDIKEKFNTIEDALSLYSQYNEKNINDKINDLIGTLSKIPKMEDKDLSTGKYFFGQFLTNVTSFTMSLYNYGFKDEK